MRHHQSNVDIRRSTVCVRARTLTWTPAACAAPQHAPHHTSTHNHHLGAQRLCCMAGGRAGGLGTSHHTHTPCPDIPTGPVELLQLVSALFLQSAPSIPPLHAALPNFSPRHVRPSIRALLSCVGVASPLGLPFLLCPHQLIHFLSRVQLVACILLLCYLATCYLAHALPPHPAQQHVALLPVRCTVSSVADPASVWAA